MSRAEVDVDNDDLRAVDGRVPGRRGRATRQRLLDQTAVLLETTSYRDLKVIDIAREAGTSPATFYQYFTDVEAAVLSLAEDMVAASDLVDLARQSSWRGAGATTDAERLVDGFLRFWDANRPVLRVVDLAADEGDEQFRKVRAELLNQVAAVLADQFGELQAAGRHPDGLDPMAQVGVLVVMLAHVAGHQPGFELWGIGEADLRTSLIRQVAWGMSGQKPAA